MSYIESGIKQFNDNKEKFYELARNEVSLNSYRKGDTILFPIFIDGVMDSLYYDVASEKFTKIVFSVGEGSGLLLSDTRGYFDGIKNVEAIIEG